jgi:hypothetical protein
MHERVCALARGCCLLPFVAMGCRAEPEARAPTQPSASALPSSALAVPSRAPAAAGNTGPRDPDSAVSLPNEGDWLTWEIAALEYTIMVAIPPTREPAPGEQLPRPATECVRVHQRVASSSYVRCAVAPAGDAWFVQVEQTPANEGNRTGRWRVGHTHAKGLKFGEWQRFSVVADSYTVNNPPAVVSFQDVTGDGVPEAALAGIERVTSGGSERFLHVYVDTPSGVERFPPTGERAAFALLDCNGDRKPEVYYDPYRSPGSEDSIAFTSVNRRTAPAWSLLADGVRGGFLTTGPLAVAYARALCADVADDAPLSARDPGTWPHVIHCRRLAGASADRLEEELVAACAGATQSLRTFCESNQQRFVQMMRTALPISTKGKGEAAPPCLLPSD